jgi:hypothetical protein
MPLLNTLLEKQNSRKDSCKLADAIYRNNTTFKKHLEDQIKRLENDTMKLAKNMETNVATFQIQLREKHKEWLREQEKQSFKMYHYVYKYRNSNANKAQKAVKIINDFDECYHSDSSDLSDSHTITSQKKKKPILIVSDFKNASKKAENLTNDTLEDMKRQETAFFDAKSTLKISRSVSFREPSSNFSKRSKIISDKLDTNSQNNRSYTRNNEYKEVLSQSFYLSKNVPKITTKQSKPQLQQQQKQTAIGQSTIQRKESLYSSLIRQPDSVTMSYISINDSLKSRSNQNYTSDSRFMNLISTLACFN